MLLGGVIAVAMTRIIKKDTLLLESCVGCFGVENCS